MASTTVSWPSLASADSAAVAAAGGSWTCTSSPAAQWSTSRIPTVSPKDAARMEHAKTAQRCRVRRASLLLAPAVRPGAGPAAGRTAADARTVRQLRDPGRHGAHLRTAYRPRRPDATDHRVGDEAVDRLARGEAVAHLRAGHVDLRAVDPADPPARRDLAAPSSVGRRDDGQGGQPLQVVGALPGVELGTRSAPTTRKSSARPLAPPRPGPPRSSRPSSSGRHGRSRGGWPRRRGSRSARAWVRA